MAICLAHSRNVGHVLLPLLIVVLYLSAFRGRISSAIFSHPVITNIGGMCYGIYFFHLLIIHMKHLTAPIHFGENFWFYFILQSCFIVPVVLLSCGIFFVLIERPCMDRECPRKLWHQAQTLLLSRAEQAQS
jgi:peptidoglycan/LPS O-acetylase OafA/YrhL